MLTVSLFIKTIKKYANNISVSDETFFRDFFQYFIDAFNGWINAVALWRKDVKYGFFVFI